MSNDPSEQIRWLGSEGFHLLQDESHRDRNLKNSEQQLNSAQKELLTEQRQLRKRAKRRFPDFENWIWTDRSLSQASDWWTADFKATLFPKNVDLLDACCGAGSDLIAIARHQFAIGDPETRSRVIGIDHDETLTQIARANLSQHGIAAEVIHDEFSIRAVEQFLGKRRTGAHLTAPAWLHIDPDRRPAQMGVEKKTTIADRFEPSIATVLHCAEKFDGIIIKVAPSTVFDPSDLANAGQMHRMWIGAQGECKQQLLLLRDAQRSISERYLNFRDPESSVRSEAQITYLDSAACVTESINLDANNTETAAPAMRFAVALQIEELDRCVPAKPHIAICSEASVINDLEHRSETAVESPADFIHELHPVLHAAEMQLRWASKFGLSALNYEHGYFTSSHIPQPADSPWLQSFRVLDVLGWDDRKVRKCLRGLDAGPVEVKCRGHKIDANLFQRKYSRSSGRPVTLLVTRFQNRIKCIVAERVSVTDDS